MKKSIISKAVTGMCAMYEFSGGKTLLLHVKYCSLMCSEHKADEYLVISNHKYKQGTNVVRVSVTTEVAQVVHLLQNGKYMPSSEGLLSQEHGEEILGSWTWLLSARKKRMSPADPCKIMLCFL